MADKYQKGGLHLDIDDIQKQCSTMKDCTECDGVPHIVISVNQVEMFFQVICYDCRRATPNEFDTPGDAILYWNNIS